MYSRKSLFTVGLCLVALVALALAGCGDDNKTTSTKNTLTGAAYTQSSTHVTALVDSSITVIGNGLATVVIGATDEDFAQIPGLFYGSGGDVVADSAWVVVSNTNLATNVSDFYIDSLQYRRDNQVQFEARSADALTIRHLWRRTTEDTTVAYGNYEIKGNLVAANLDGDNATISGTVNLDFDSKITVNQEPIWENISAVSTYNDFVINGSDNWVNGCPGSGVVNATVQYIRKVGDAAPDTTNFEFTLTFQNGVAQSEAVSGAQSASYTTDYCDVSAN